MSSWKILSKAAVYAVIAAGSVALLTLAAPDPAAAASACKGLAESGCAAKAETCSWIKATVTKSGKPRKAYCRTKSSRKPKA